MHFVPAYLVAALYAVGGMAVALPAPAPEAAPEPVSKPLDRQIFARA